jgi:hypothetical protein
MAIGQTASTVRKIIRGPSNFAIAFRFNEAI